MKRLSAEAKVGFFLVAVLLGLVYLTTQINSSGWSLRGGHSYYLYFEDVSGLLPRTPVEYSGIRIGQVREIRLDGREVVVEVVIDRHVVVYDDTRVSMQTRGLLGEKIIQFSGGGQGIVIPPGGSIRRTEPARSFDKAIENFSELSMAIRDLIKGGEGKASINDVIENATKITEDLRQVVEGRKSDLDKVISNLRMITDSVGEFVGSDEGALKEMAQSMRQTIERLDRIVARVESGEGTIGKLLHDEETVDRLNDALDGVNEFVGTFRQTEIAVGFRGEYMGSERDPIAVTSLRLQPTFDKYFLFEVTDAPLSFGRRRRTLTETTTSGGTTVIEEVQSSDRFTFTALLARRFHFLTLQAGLIRSTGGLGVEAHFWRDRLSLGVQLFDLKRAQNPHVRALARFNLVGQVLFVQGGVDDIFHKDSRRNFFAGAGFMITEADLKRFLGLAPLALSQ